MNRRGLIWLEFKKASFLFLIPLFAFVCFYNWHNQEFLRQYANYTRFFDPLCVSYDVFGITHLLIYFAGAVALAVTLFNNDEMLFNLSLPIARKGLLIPKLAVAVVFVLLFLIADLSGFFLVLNDNILWVRDSFAPSDNPELFLRHTVLRYVVQTVLRAADLMSLFLTVAFLISVLRNKIVSAIMGVMFLYLPTAAFTVFSNITQKFYSVINWIVPFNLQTDIHNYSDKIYISVLSDSSVVSTYSPRFLIYRFFSMSGMTGYLSKIVVLSVMIILVRCFYGNVKALDSKGFILYPFAERIFVFSTGIYFSLFANTLGSYVYYHNDINVQVAVHSVISIVSLAIGFAAGYIFVRFTSGRKSLQIFPSLVRKGGCICLLVCCLLLTSCSYTFINSAADSEAVRSDDYNQAVFIGFTESVGIILDDMQNNITEDRYGMAHNTSINTEIKMSGYTEDLEELFAGYGFDYPGEFIRDAEDNVAAEWADLEKDYIDKEYFFSDGKLNYLYDIWERRSSEVSYYTLRVNAFSYECSVLPTEYENYAYSNGFYVNSYIPGDITVLGYKSIPDTNHPECDLEIIYFMKGNEIEKTVIRFYVHVSEMYDTHEDYDSTYLDRLDVFLEKCGVTDTADKTAVKQAISEGYLNKTARYREELSVRTLNAAYRNSSSSVSQTIEVQIY